MHALHWARLVPSSFGEARALALWTAPFAGACAALALLRERRVLDLPKQIGPITAIADALQTSQRNLRYHPDSSQDDVRVLYFLATLRAVLVATPWVYTLLPLVVLQTDLLPLRADVLSLGGAFGGGVLVRRGELGRADWESERECAGRDRAALLAECASRG